MAILPSHRKGIHYIERCRVIVKNESLSYVGLKDDFQKFWHIPYGNSNVLLLGTGTSITQPAARMLSDEGVMLGFTGGGGVPLFLASQSEYRPTKYCQRWHQFWWDTEKRFVGNQFFQQQRCVFVEKAWGKLRKSEKALANFPDPSKIITQYKKEIATAKNAQQLLGYEGNFTKRLYATVARYVNKKKFTRKAGKKDAMDLFNSYLDHGNYLAYGLAATVLWVLGISHSMPVTHGLTRRGALVFDVADMIKDGAILPNAFLAASGGKSDQEMRNQCVAFMDKIDALDFMFRQVKDLTKKTCH